jgi:hypothetical protein
MNSCVETVSLTMNPYIVSHSLAKYPRVVSQSLYVKIAVAVTTPAVLVRRGRNATSRRDWSPSLVSSSTVTPPSVISHVFTHESLLTEKESKKTSSYVQAFSLWNINSNIIRILGRYKI